MSRTDGAATSREPACTAGLIPNETGGASRMACVFDVDLSIAVSLAAGAAGSTKEGFVEEAVRKHIVETMTVIRCEERDAP